MAQPCLICGGRRLGLDTGQSRQELDETGFVTTCADLLDDTPTASEYEKAGVSTKLKPSKVMAMKTGDARQTLRQGSYECL